MPDEIVGKPNKPKPNYSQDEIEERLLFAATKRRYNSDLSLENNIVNLINIGLKEMEKDYGN